MSINRIDDYQRIAHETADYPAPIMLIAGQSTRMEYTYPALGLAEEAGEVAGKFSKAVRDDKGYISPERKEEIKKELGDVLWFVAELCTCLDLNLTDVAQKNLDKLASRKERGVIHGSGDDR